VANPPAADEVTCNVSSNQWGVTGLEVGGATYQSDTGELTCVANCGCDLSYSNCSIKAGDCWGIQREKGQHSGQATIKITLTRWIDRHSDSDLVCAARFANANNNDFVLACQKFCQPFFTQNPSVTFPAACVTPKTVQLQHVETSGAVQGE
jgi:hypothetical protein